MCSDGTFTCPESYVNRTKKAICDTADQAVHDEKMTKDNEKIERANNEKKQVIKSDSSQHE